MLSYLNKVFVKHHALTNVLNADVLVCIMNGCKLFFVQINGRKAQNVICHVGKATGIGSGS